MSRVIPHHHIAPSLRSVTEDVDEGEDQAAKSAEELGHLSL